ncbi:MAG: DUF1992 domain-containing protein [Spirochaetes bacterium]|jgi:hypothetical protein|nr:DUF1992 domain-containing protein [Spirochaetota bacterium]
MFVFEIIAERRIQEAIKKGDMDNLPLSGKPLPGDGLENIPQELRMAYKILKNAGLIPEELELKKTISSLSDLIKNCVDEIEKAGLQNTLNEKQLRYNLLMERRLNRTIDPFYYPRVMDKLGRKK